MELHELCHRNAWLPYSSALCAVGLVLPRALPEELVSVFRAWGSPPEQSHCDGDRRCLRALLCSGQVGMV